MNGNTDRRGLRVVKASYPRVRLCVCGEKKSPGGMFICVQMLHTGAFSMYSYFMFTCAEKRCWLNERRFVQCHSSITCRGGLTCVNAALTLERERKKVETGKGEEGGWDVGGGVKGKVKREKKLFLEKCVRSVECDATGRGRGEECFRF